MVAGEADEPGGVFTIFFAKKATILVRFMDAGGLRSYNQGEIALGREIGDPSGACRSGPGLESLDRDIRMSETTDRVLLDLIRRRGPATVVELSKELGVTGTAVRNRLARLLATGLVERKTEHIGRGRPRHAYQASQEAHKRLGQNYTDLAVALWEEMMASVSDRKLRRMLFLRITERLAEVYRSKLTGHEWEGRLVQLSHVLHDRGVEAEVARDDAGLATILRQYSCPYYELAETDRAICSLERKMLEKVLGRGLRLSQCRLDGDRSCDFEAKPGLSAFPSPVIDRRADQESTRTAAPA